jgi:maltose O-acetyltransferase
MSSSRLGRVVSEELNGMQPSLVLALGVTRWLPDLVGNRCRAFALRAAGVRIGPGTVIGGGIRIVGAGRCQDRFVIGARGWINAGCYFDATHDITIGDEVAIGQQVLVLTQTHHLADSVRRAGELTSAPVSIGTGSWIGARAVILPGVDVAPGAVVASGAVVTTDVARDTLVGGVPARPIRALRSGPT